MANTFDEMDIWILKNSEKIEKLAKARTHLAGKFEEWINNTIESTSKEISKDYNITPRKIDNGILIDKTSWPKNSTWDRVSFSIWFMDYESLASDDSQVSVGVVFHLGAKENREDFHSLLKQHFIGKDLSKTGYGSYYNVDFSSIDSICKKIESGNEKEIQLEISAIINELFGVAPKIEKFLKENNIK